MTVFPGKTNISLSINFVGEKRIKNINKIYRKKDAVTDVISFANIDNDFISQKGEVDLGDVFICTKQISRQARENNVSFQEENIRIIIHGLLHLKGYDHVIKKDAEKMFSLQEKLIKKFL